PSSGTTGGTITYTVAANTGPQRTGQITVAGPGGSATLIVEQAGQPCVYTLNPASDSVPADGGLFRTTLTRSASCVGSWTPSSDVPWLSGFSPNSGSADATIGYNVAANPGPQRTGHITVAGPGGSAMLTVTQAALPCTYTLAPSAVTVQSNGGMQNAV